MAQPVCNLTVDYSLPRRCVESKFRKRWQKRLAALKKFRGTFPFGQTHTLSNLRCQAWESVVQIKFAVKVKKNLVQSLLSVACITKTHNLLSKPNCRSFQKDRNDECFFLSCHPHHRSSLGAKDFSLHISTIMRSLLYHKMSWQHLYSFELSPRSIASTGRKLPLRHHHAVQCQSAQAKQARNG